MDIINGNGIYVKYFNKNEFVLTLIEESKKSICSINEKILKTLNKGSAFSYKIGNATLLIKKNKKEEIKTFLFSTKVFDKRGASSSVFSGVQFERTEEGTIILKNMVLKIPKHKHVCLEEEKNSLNKLYGNEKKLKFIQKKFKSLKIKNELCLITKKYEGNLHDLVMYGQLTFNQLFKCFKEMTLAVDLIIKKGFITLDVKTLNTLYKKDKENNFKVVLCDINPTSEEDVLNEINAESISPRSPAHSTTAIYLTIFDFTKLSKSVKHCSTSRSESRKLSYVKTYFEIAKKMMVYQLGTSFFELLTKKKCVRSSELEILQGSTLRASNLSNQSIEERVKEAFKNLSKTECWPFLEKSQDLLLKMLKVTDVERIDISEVVKEISVIEETLNPKQEMDKKRKTDKENQANKTNNQAKKMKRPLEEISNNEIRKSDSN